MDVIGIAGSLRRGSYNKMVLSSAAELAPSGMTVVQHSLDRVPLYNFDVEEQGDPPAVRELKDAIAGATGLLIVTPEYQQGVPGVLKNALDWASRPPGGSPLQGKPVAVMGATPGMTATARAQTQLRQSLTYNACPVLPPPEILIGRVHDKVDADRGVVTDEPTRNFIGQAMERFAEWIRTAPSLP